MEEKEEEIRKTCRICSVKKNLDAFYRGNCKYGRLNVCKKCDDKRREYQRQANIEQDLKQKREYRREHKDFLRGQQEIFYYAHRKEESARKKEFYKNNRVRILRRQKRYYQENKEKREAYRKEYYKENQEAILKRGRDYSKTEKGAFLCKLKCQRRRARLNSSRENGKISLEQWQKILAFQNNKCNVCSKKFTKTRKPSIDHIIPLFHGGSSMSDNIQALCSSCNSTKHSTLDPQFIQTWNHNTKSPSNIKQVGNSRTC